jgi:hypothetical protein
MKLDRKQAEIQVQEAEARATSGKCTNTQSSGNEGR